MKVDESSVEDVQNGDEAVVEEVNAMIDDLLGESSTVEEEAVSEEEEVTSEGEPSEEGSSEEELSGSGEESSEEGGEEVADKEESSSEEGEEDVSWRDTLVKMAEDHLKAGTSDEVVVEKDAGKIEEDVKKQEPIPEDQKAVFVDSIRITDDEFDSAISSKEGMQKILDKIEAASAERMQQLIRAIPKVIRSVADEVVSTRLAISDFYQANSDLLPFKPLVKFTINKLQSENPDMDLEELLDKAGKEVRKVLKLEHGGNGRSREKVKPATVEKSSGSRKPQPPKLTGIEAEIDEILKLGQ